MSLFLALCLYERDIVHNTMTTVKLKINFCNYYPYLIRTKIFKY